MKKSIFNIFLFLMTISLSCSKNGFEEPLITKEYNLPEGEPGSVDNMIYNFNKKYETFILYDFEKDDYSFKWNTTWSKFYKPADLSNDKKYVKKMLETIDKYIFKKHDDEFVKKYFPYKVFLTDTLCEGYGSYSEKDIVDMLYNGVNAVAISNVGEKQELYTEKDWDRIGLKLEYMFTTQYYKSFSIKPQNFISTRFIGSMRPPTDTPKYATALEKRMHTLFTYGYVVGTTEFNTATPILEDDYASFVAFLTGFSGTNIKRVINKYPRMKERTKSLMPFLIYERKMNIVKIQNENNPEDKLPEDYFNTL